MQMSLSYAAFEGGEDGQHWLAWIRRAVDVIGHKTVAGELDIAPSHLTDALLGRERKSVKLEWLPKLLRMVGEEMRLEALRVICNPHGYEPMRTTPLTDKERADRMEVALKMLGPVGEQAMRNALGGD